MQKLQCLILVLQALSDIQAASKDRRTEANKYHTDPVGYAHGKPFDDLSYINGPTMQDHRRISEITFHGCAAGEHLSGFDIGYRDETFLGPQPLVKHGSAGKVKKWIPLDPDEYIVSIDVTTWTPWTGKVIDTHHTRIGSMRVISNKNRVLVCGSDFLNDPKTTFAPKNGALLYFTGSEGKAIDQLQAHWIPKEDF